MEHKFYIVGEEIIPEAMKKTVKVKKLLQQGKEKKVKEAVKRAGLSRSTYYNYKDHIFAVVDEQRKELATLSMLIVDERGLLSEVLAKIADKKGNILTINQDIPLADVAHVTITIEIDNLVISLAKLLEELNELSGIRKVNLITKTYKLE